MMRKILTRWLQALCWWAVDHDKEHCYDRIHSGDELCDDCEHR